MINSITSLVQDVTPNRRVTIAVVRITLLLDM